MALLSSLRFFCFNLRLLKPISLTIVPIPRSLITCLRRFLAPIPETHGIRFELLPHHWRTETAMQEKFNARIKRAVLGNQEFTLLCNQEFWEDFQAWLHREFTDHFEIISVKSFSSSQVLRLKKIGLLSKKNL